MNRLFIGTARAHDRVMQLDRHKRDSLVSLLPEPSTSIASWRWLATTSAARGLLSPEEAQTLADGRARWAELTLAERLVLSQVYLELVDPSVLRSGTPRILAGR